ncbi:hypothetical protein BOO22_21390 [Vibrio cidicii]|uniref:hypothetical protein n=1 Tax=Vibrio cidicii TaxID=1763883 RepID=UPI0018C229CE|nr:hypothetical protein [Vibrio cidicii]MBG0761949.1 hypothetical protein [Vibrio cidicii]
MYNNIKHSVPMEREYEGWIVAEIESYFEALGIKCSIWAVGVQAEKYWPADEQLLANGAFIGLQMKKAELSSGKVKKLKWSFSQPSQQLADILKFDDIYYCLPTFINRDVKKVCLHHCIFWRPKTAQRKTGWYYNLSARVASSYRRMFTKMRWGLFSELLIEGHIGKKFSSSKQANEYLSEVVARAKNVEDGSLKNSYLIWVEL